MPIVHRVRCLVLGCIVIAAPAATSAQNDPAPASRRIQALRLSQADVIRLDGLPDEAVWERVRPATDFLQRDPNNGDPATERTEVRIVYDADRLVLSVICHDSQPDRVLGNQMQRDRSFEADDRFMWTIDTFLDGRTGYYFEINPAGAMGDGLVDPAADGGWNNLGTGINRSWDGIWLARVRRTTTGWTAEVEIPFRTVNFDPNADAWGINFQRTIRRKNEDVLWTGHARNQGLARMTNAGRLEGLGGISQGLGLDVKPYIVGNVSSAPGRGRADALSTGDVGVDAFYNLTPALRANVSVNTDFAETEVDQRRVNLTRFPLFFEEKRDFFLEGSSFFDFSREDEEAVVPFFSRRLGLDDRGTPQPIDAGAKLTGQAGAFDVGVLQVRTAESGRRLGEDFSVLRVRRRAFEQSYVGGMYTRRSARLRGDVDRHTAGLDFELATSRFRGDQNLEFSGFYLWTSSPVQAGNTAAYGVRLAYPNDPLTAEVSIRELQPNYDPAVGFVERRGYKRLAPNVEYSWRTRDHPWLRALGWEAELEFINDPQNRPLTRQVSLSPLEVNFHDGSRVAIEIQPQYERLEEDFEIHDDIVLPAGAVYRFTSYQLQGSTADHRVINVQGDVSIGDFFSGRRREYSVELGVRPRRGVALNFEAEHNVLELAEGSFDTDVFRLRADTQFSPWLSLANNVQYDNVSGLLGWQMRFRWIRRPGNDLYLVYTHNWREVLETGFRRLTTLDNRLATKLVYTLRF
ncbi:MAG: carbohydrate binding family 9 domain-containing protein [Acidobacteria bacterium]|nr:carbohydrate binding family 9 domain-containing protein [Acidobacteriota bacterium]